MNSPRRDCTTAIHSCHGYSLFLEQDKPVVVRKWTTSKMNDKGVKEKQYHEETLDLDGDQWPNTVTANSVRIELRQALKDWREWNTAMKEAKHV